MEGRKYVWREHQFDGGGNDKDLDPMDTRYILCVCVCLVLMVT